PAWTALPSQQVEPARVLDRQVPEKCRIHDGEADRVDADAERQRHDGRSRKPGFLGNQTEGEAQILQHGTSDWIVGKNVSCGRRTAARQFNGDNVLSSDSEKGGP